MGKKQHQRDKLWLTCTEWKTLYGGKKTIESNKNRFRRLPFYCCSLKYDHTTHPCCTKEGIVFDMQNILEYIKKHKMNPVTGKKLSAKNLIKLTFHKNIEGEYHCPITYRPLGDNSHIVAVPCSGNVFSMEGITMSNLRIDEWSDPLTKQTFTKADLIVIQDPNNLDKFNMSTFYHSTTERAADKAEETASGTTIRFSSTLAAEAIKEVQEMAKKRVVAKQEEQVVLKDKINEANYSTGKVSASLTSTVAPVAWVNDSAVLADDTVRYSRVTEKGYVSLVTNFGRINLELFCELVPKTCENFIRLCHSGYYDNTVFHRLIRHFVLQGGDPTGKGTGGQSCWGAPFADEISPKQSHNARGVLSMANLGPNKNTSQFFILLRPAKQLDKKHTIFGRLVGGMKVLDEIEKIESDNADRPIEPIEILCTEVFVDPFEKVDEAIRAEREQMRLDAVQPPVDTSLLPRNKREEDLLIAKQLQGTQRLVQAGSSSVAKFLADVPVSNGGEKARRAGTLFKRPMGPPEEVPDTEESEYALKQKRRVQSAVGSRGLELLSTHFQLAG